MRLLIVDDDQVFREELADLLRGEGHEVEVAPSVPKAVEQLESQNFDLVMTDLKMPRHGGLELLKAVKERWPQTLTVMITGFATVESAVDAMKLGAFDYIRKPFQIAQVQQVLQLASEEIRFQGSPREVSTPDVLLRGWLRRDGLEVLLITPRMVRPQTRVTVTPLNVAEPFRLKEALESFFKDRPRGAVLVEGADLLFAGRKRADIIDLFRSLREAYGSRGPFVVTFDPERMAEDAASELRAALVAPLTHSTLESLSNPIRRAVLRRVVQGSCTFNQAMQAAGLDDSPKLSFHLRKLVDDGLLAHQADKYRATPRGEEAIRVLAEMDSLPLTGPQGSAVLPAPPSS